MKHLYVEGIVVEVSEERAAEMVNNGSWYRCDHQHVLPEKYTDGHCVSIYHKHHLEPKR